MMHGLLQGRSLSGNSRLRGHLGRKKAGCVHCRFRAKFRHESEQSFKTTGVPTVSRPDRIPDPVVRRLTKYLAHLQQLQRGAEAWVLSQGLAQALDLTDSTVRQDLSHLDFSGRAMHGYEVEGLQRALINVLGLDATCNAVVAGAGNLGRALALHEGFRRQDFNICGIFDIDPRLFGEKIGHLVVQKMDALPGVVRDERVDIGIVAVPASAARVVAFELISAGVRGLLNLACAHVTVPKDVVIVDARIVEGLQQLSYAIKMQARANED